MMAYIVYHTYWELKLGASRRRLIQKHGCQPVNRTNTSLLSRVFDTKEVKRIIAAVGLIFSFSHSHSFQSTSFYRDYGRYGL